MNFNAAIASKTQGFMLLLGLLGINMSKSELDQSQLIKLVVKALAIAGDFISLSH